MSSTSLKSTNWTFINENTRDSGVKRQVRVHVMREYSRKQRSKQIERHIRDQVDCSKKSEGLRHGETVMYLPTPRTRGQPDPGSPISSYSTTPMDTPSPIPPLDTPFRDPSETGEMDSVSTPSFPNPQTTPGVVKDEAVGCLPMALNDRDHDLVDFWMDNIPSHTAACVPRLEPPFAPLRDVLFSLAMTGPAPFQLIVLDYAALLQARQMGVKETRTSILHRARAVRMVNERIQECLHRGRSSIPDLVAVLAMAITEDIFGTKHHSLIHSRAAKHIIVELGGPSAIANNRPLEIFAHWVIVTTEGFGYDISPPAYKDANRLHDDFDEFMSFVESAQKLSIAQKFTAHDSTMVRRQDLFGTGSQAYRQLYPSPDEHRSQYDTNCHLYCRVAILLYITVTLFDLRSSPTASERFLQAMTLRLGELDCDYSPPSLLFWMFLNETSLFDSHRMWHVQRLMSVMKQLHYDRIHRISEALLAFLSFESDPQGIDFLDVFDTVGLRGEAFGFEIGVGDNCDSS